MKCTTADHNSLDVYLVEIQNYNSTIKINKSIVFVRGRNTKKIQRALETSHFAFPVFYKLSSIDDFQVYRSPGIT